MNLNGIEIDKDIAFISKIRLAVLSNKEPNIVVDDALTYDFGKKFDKIFCEYPFGLRVDSYRINKLSNQMFYSWNKPGLTSDWIFLNNIIYKIYTVSDITEMREQFLDQMKMLIDYDSADFHLASPDGENRLVSPVLYNCEEDLSMVYEEIDYSRGILYGGRTLIYRETDIISDAKRMEADYYKKVYKANQWHYSLQMVLARNN